jgi:hypothetical protein
MNAITLDDLIAFVNKKKGSSVFIHYGDYFSVHIDNEFVRLATKEEVAEFIASHLEPPAIREIVK